MDLINDNITFRQFIVLFKNLPEDCAIIRIIKIRNLSPSEIKDVELKKYRESILLEKEETPDALMQFANSL